MSVRIIAEAGVNHNGSVEMALRLVDAAAEAGADYVKFQTFKSDKLVRRSAPKADYQTRTTTAGESQFEMLKRLELDEESHMEIARRCAQRRISFISSPFDIESLEFLVRRLDVPLIKLGSGEITNAPLLLAAARSGKSVILSTGMSTLGDIEAALGALAFGYLGAAEVPSQAGFDRAYCSPAGRDRLRSKVTLLHCTTEYPAPFESTNLRTLGTLATAFGLDVGFSDHTQGISIPIAAVALGATVVEKHFTLDRSLAGPDHLASLEPSELALMVAAIRQTEMALGTAVKVPAPVELANRVIARKSLVASRPIAKGEAFTEANLTVKRPGNGVSPFEYWSWIGKTSLRDYDEDEALV